MWDGYGKNPLLKRSHTNKAVTIYLEHGLEGIFKALNDPFLGEMKG